MQRVMANAVAACTLLNVGTVLSVSALELAASASFVAAGVFGVVTLASWFKVCAQHAFGFDRHVSCIVHERVVICLVLAML